MKFLKQKSCLQDFMYNEIHKTGSYIKYLQVYQVTKPF